MSIIQSLTLSARADGKTSHGQAGTGNYLVQGDNLEVLREIEPEYHGLVRCVYIDPPYNNQEVYAHYLDGKDHDEWLQDMECRLSLLWPLLRQDGSLWVSIDDREAHYLKVLCDRLFGRDRFVATIVWNHRKSRENRRVFSFNHEYILVYAPNPGLFASSRHELPLSSDVVERYKNPDDDPRGPWQSVSVNVQAGHGVASQFYGIVAPSGVVHWPPAGRCWIYNEDRMRREVEANNIWFGRDGRGVPRVKKFLRASNRGLTPETLWTADQVGSTHEAKREIINLFPGSYPFDTPKPERLISTILEIATDPGDLVVDAYLGSGTTTAVAHKMRRSYLGIESGDHAASLCVIRMRRVIEGEQGGITRDVQWTGGGGFEFVRWGSSLSEKEGAATGA
jgi:adenine-specific DNA-methyltransferase